MITTLRHLKLWKRRGSAGGAGAKAGAGTSGSVMFRSPSSDSGYSDVPPTIALRSGATNAAKTDTKVPLPSPVELLPPSRTGFDRPAIRVTAPPATPTPAVDDGRPGVDVSTARSEPRPAAAAAAAASGGSMTDRGLCILRRQDMVSVESFFDFVKRRDVESIQFALRDAHYDIDAQDAVRSLHFAFLSLCLLLQTYYTFTGLKSEIKSYLFCLPFLFY